MIIVTLCMISQDHGTVTITPSAPANARIRDPFDSPPLIVGSGAAMHTSIRSAWCAASANLGFHQSRRISDVARDKLASDLKTKDEKGASIRTLAESTRQSYGCVHWAHSTSV